MALRCISLACLGLTLASAQVVAGDKASPLPERFRDIKMYWTGRADAKDPRRLHVTTSVRNEGKKPLDIKASLAANPDAGFQGSEFAKVVAPGQATDWIYEVRPPVKFRRAVLRGEV